MSRAGGRRLLKQLLAYHQHLQLYSTSSMEIQSDIFWNNHLHIFQHCSSETTFFSFTLFIDFSFTEISSFPCFPSSAFAIQWQNVLLNLKVSVESLLNCMPMFCSAWSTINPTDFYGVQWMQICAECCRDKAQMCNQGFDLCNAIEEKLYCAIYYSKSTIYLLAVAELEHQHLWCNTTEVQ